MINQYLVWLQTFDFYLFVYFHIYEKQRQFQQVQKEGKIVNANRINQNILEHQIDRAMRITYVKERSIKQSTQTSQFKDEQTFFDEKSKYIFYSNQQMRKLEVNHEWELQSIRKSLKYEGPCEKIELQKRTYSGCVSNHFNKNPLIFKEKRPNMAIKLNNLKPSAKVKLARVQKRNSIKKNSNNLQDHKSNDDCQSIRSFSTNQQSTIKNLLKKKVFQMDDSSIILTENDLSLQSSEFSSENQVSIQGSYQQNQSISESEDSMQMIFKKIRISDYLKNEHNLLPQIELQFNKFKIE